MAQQTLEQFGQTVKAKHPEYSDMSDTDVGNKVIAKYPQYKDMVSSTPTEKPWSPFATDTIVGKVGNFLTQGTQKFGNTMGNALAAPKNAQMYSDSMKQHTDVQNQLVKAIQTKKEMGQDTSHLETALHNHATSVPKLEDFTGDVINKTTQQVLGEAAGVLPEALAGGAIEGVKGLGLVKSATQSAEEAYKAKQAYDTLSKGAKLLDFAKKSAQLAKTTGGLGYAMDVSQGLQENKGAESFIPRANTVMGVVAAPIAEALPGVISKGKNLFNKSESEIASKNILNAEKSLFPKLSEKEKAILPKKDISTLFGKKSVPDLLQNSETKKLIDSTANLPEDIRLKPSDTPTLKESKINQGISRLHSITLDNLAQPEVKLQTQFNPNDLRNHLQDTILTPIEQEFGKTSKEFATAQKGIETAIESVPENNAYGTHVGRQNFDTQFKKNNSRAFASKDTLAGKMNTDVQNTIQTGYDIRNEMNNFTENLLPEGHPYRTNLKEESNLIKAKQTMQKRSTGQLDKNAVTRYLDRNPTVKKGTKTLSQILKFGSGVDIANHLLP